MNTKSRGKLSHTCNYTPKITYFEQCFPSEATVWEFSLDHTVSLSCLSTYSYKIKTNVWFYCLISNAHHFAISLSLTVLYQWTLPFYITGNKTMDLSALYHVMCLKRAELVLLSSPSYIIRER